MFACLHCLGVLTLEQRVMMCRLGDTVFRLRLSCHSNCAVVVISPDCVVVWAVALLFDRRRSSLTESGGSTWPTWQTLLWPWRSHSWTSTTSHSTTSCYASVSTTLHLVLRVSLVLLLLWELKQKMGVQMWRDEATSGFGMMIYHSSFK